jgi:hypothetical protein
MIATKSLPFRRQRFAARTGKTGKTSTLHAENVRGFLSNALLPKSEEWQIFVAKPPKELSYSRSTYGKPMVQ